MGDDDVAVADDVEAVGAADVATTTVQPAGTGVGGRKCAEFESEA